MPNPQKPGRVANFFGRTLDRIIPGNNWNPNAAPGSRLTVTPGQAIGAVGSVVGNAFLPGSGPVIRSVTHGATTGQGLFGFLQPRGNFTGSPINQLPMNTSFPLAQPSLPGGLTPATLDPVTPIPFTLPQIDPTINGSIPAPTGAQPRGPTQPTMPLGGMAALSGVAAQMGGARGARTWGGGGITGDAARALMQGLRMGPQYIYTGSGGNKQQ